ncbi:MAG: phosphoenolpyruvate--protein phosphotransferase [Vicinamibacteria bacterium]|nr:phosphoenolpyruvate--protein phosphotransferase [Vicinamibacteria bacterium]
MRRLSGTGVSSGIAIGPALVVENSAAPVFRLALAPDASERETERLSNAVEASRLQLQAIKERLLRDLGPHAYIFDAQLLMLDDPLLVQRAMTLVKEKGVNAEWALHSITEELHEFFRGFKDAYLRERSADIDDVVGRILLNLGDSAEAPSLAHLPDRFVLVAGDLTPSQAAELDWERVLGIVTDAGSPTYHTAILARSLGIPGVVGLNDATSLIAPGSNLVVDGSSGGVIVDPGHEELEAYRAAQERERLHERRLQETRGLPAETKDGVKIVLMANAEFAEEATTALRYGAEGIGLFRSEYLLGRSREWPSEKQQLDLYRRLIEQMRPYPVTIRVWDLGSGEMDGTHAGPRVNPALGERALRLMRRFPEPFRTQLRALLRAAASGPLRIMFPFASGPSDLRIVRELIDDVCRDLRRDGIEFRADAPIGLTLEVPSAAATVDLLAREVDFFSVGTNDLIQYLLAVDRADPRVAGFYEPLHPAVLRTIQGIVRVAREQQIPISVCGEMAGNPFQALVLIGLGVRELSMSATAIPRVKAAIRAVDACLLARLAESCLVLPTASEIEARIRSELAVAVPEASLEETQPSPRT